MSETSYTIQKQGAEIEALLNSIGSVDTLETDAKDTLVDAINELFTSASNGKAQLAAAITGKGVDTAATDSFSTMAGNIESISAGIARLVTNDDSITPTGTYATSTYYNTTYGVKIGYCSDGSILLSMQGGTSTGYETIYFSLASAPDGVSITEAHNTSTSYVTGKPALIYACVLTGITTDVTISVAMDSVNASYDYVNCAITVTEV